MSLQGTASAQAADTHDHDARPKLTAHQVRAAYEFDARHEICKYALTAYIEPGFYYSPPSAFGRVVNELERTTDEEITEVECAIDYLMQRGFAEKSVATPIIYTRDGKRSGERTVEYELTEAGQEEAERLRVLDGDINERQYEWYCANEGTVRLEALQAASTDAARLVDYMIAEQTAHPNQAHFARELGMGSKQVRTAIKELVDADIMHRAAGSGTWYNSSPTYYDFTSAGKNMKTLMQEQAAASPSMSALMNDA